MGRIAALVRQTYDQLLAPPMPDFLVTAHEQIVVDVLCISNRSPSATNPLDVDTLKKQVWLVYCQSILT